MKTRTIASLMAAALVAGALFAPASAFAGKKKKASGPVVMGEDAAGDWGTNVDPTLAPVGDALGMDLTKAEVVRDGDNLNFVIGLNSLPPSGGVPEIARYTWTFTVDGEHTELDGKFTNFSRGTCDPTSGACPPPRNPGLYPFLVRGNCGIANDTGVSVTTCEELGIIEASFDSAAATITIPVPMELIHAKGGSKIAPAAGTLYGGMIEAVPAVFLSSGNFPADSLIGTVTYKVPK